MRRRLFILGLMVFVGGTLGFVRSCGPTLAVGRVKGFARTRAFGWNHAAVCYRPGEAQDGSIDWMIGVLPLFPMIKEINLPRVSVVNEITPLATRLSRLSNNHWLVSFDLSRLGVTDSDLAVFDGMERLECLYLTGNERITDAGLLHLGKCKSLRHLDVGGTRVSVNGLAALAGCKELKYLAMQDCSVTDENVRRIPRFAKMETIYFNGEGLTEEGLSHFLDWHYLRTFGVSLKMSKEARIEFNRQFKSEWERAKAAGENVPSANDRGRLLLEEG